MLQHKKNNDAQAVAGSKSEYAIELIGVHKWYGDFHVLKDLNLSVSRGEKIVICGPSGSGKSTAIRCINRLEEHQDGKIIVNGIEINDDLKNIEAMRREVGMVFPAFQLIPASDSFRKLHVGADLGTQAAAQAGAGYRHAIPGARAYPRSS